MAASADLLDGHLHAVDHVLAVERGAAAQRAGEADLDGGVLRPRTARANGAESKDRKRQGGKPAA
jgi:hypothetical protein